MQNFFSIFENRPIRYIFMSPIKKSANSDIYFLKICYYCTFPFAKKKIRRTFFLVGPENGQICVYTGQRKNHIYFSFSSFLAFIQTKEQILLQAQPLKMLNKQVNKQHFKDKFWIWGPSTICHNLTSAQCFSQKSRHPTLQQRKQRHKT